MTIVIPIEEYARLKAEVERLQSIHSIDSIGIEQLKAEVERLKAENEAVKLGNKEWRQTAIERGEMNAEDANAIGLLKAEVERLTKAGDAMASSIQFNEEMAKDYNGPTIVHKSVQRWNAAKEGKQ
jgi:uncharacterized small protein (DUF1192 family)